MSRPVGAKVPSHLSTLLHRQCLRALGAHHGGLGFPAARVGLPVGPDHAVDAELGVIREAAKVPSIGPVLHLLAPRPWGLVDQPLVYPVPNEASLQVGMLVIRFPVLLHIKSLNKSRVQSLSNVGAPAVMISAFGPPCFLSCLQLPTWGHKGHRYWGGAAHLSLGR